jgi:hypothetical protein
MSKAFSIPEQRQLKIMPRATHIAYSLETVETRATGPLTSWFKSFPGPVPTPFIPSFSQIYTTGSL